ncbi:MAG TPA: hypothetical protein VF118_10845 [Gemmatimonadaceae bacterium]
MTAHAGPIAAPPRSTGRPIAAIAVGGVIVGILDLAYAIIVYSPKRPILIPQSIASGLLGRASFTGGARSAILGVICHFVIALGAATVYYLASRRWRFLVDRPVVSGMIFGACVYLFMHYVVIPLSAAGPSHLSVALKSAEFVEHWFCVGLPIAFSVRRFGG